MLARSGPGRCRLQRTHVRNPSVGDCYTEIVASRESPVTTWVREDFGQEEVRSVTRSFRDGHCAAERRQQDETATRRPSRLPPRLGPLHARQRQRRVGQLRRARQRLWTAHTRASVCGPPASRPCRRSADLSATAQLSSRPNRRSSTRHGRPRFMRRAFSAARRRGSDGNTSAPTRPSRARVALISYIAACSGRPAPSGPHPASGAAVPVARHVDDLAQMVRVGTRAPRLSNQRPSAAGGG